MCCRCKLSCALQGNHRTEQRLTMTEGSDAFFFDFLFEINICS